LRYYLSSSDGSLERMAQAIRSHGSIKSQLHWSLDVTQGEEAWQVRKDNAALNLAILRRFIMNPLKLDTTPKLSVRANLKQATWDDNFRLNVLGRRTPA
jgi:predicted transposase YbfD/YdcC